MGIDKTPKLCGLAAIGLGGWLLPLAFNLSPAIEGFSLALATFSSTALALTSSRETIVSGIAHQERRMGLERLAYQMTLEHERELAQLRSLYGFGDSDDDDYQPGEPPQAQIEGATLDQRTIAGGPGSGETDRLFRLEWLLQSNSTRCCVGIRGRVKPF